MKIADAQHARPRAARRLVPAQGPSAARGPPAPGDEARLPARRGARRRRRPADAGREQADRARRAAGCRPLPEIAVAIAEQRGEPAPAGGVAAGEPAQQIARSLLSGERKAVLLGNAAVQHPQAAQLHALGAVRSRRRPARRSACWPRRRNTRRRRISPARCRGTGGLNARQMLAQPRKAYAAAGTSSPSSTRAIRRPPSRRWRRPTPSSRSRRIATAPLEYADVMLPIAPFTETAGTFVNSEGRAQSFNGAVRPPGEARPGWKVLRVLGNLLGVPGFDHETPEQVRAEALPARRRGAAVEHGLPGAAGGAGAARRRARAHRRRADLLQPTRSCAARRRCRRRATRSRRARWPTPRDARARSGSPPATRCACAPGRRRARCSTPRSTTRVPDGVRAHRRGARGDRDARARCSARSRWSAR